VIVEHANWHMIYAREFGRLVYFIFFHCANCYEKAAETVQNHKDNAVAESSQAAYCWPGAVKVTRLTAVIMLIARQSEQVQTGCFA
jgi:hypothetical protein